MLTAIRRLFANDKKLEPALQGQVLEPEEHLKHIEQNIRAITSTIHPKDQELILLKDEIRHGTEITQIELRGRQLHLVNTRTHQSKLVRFDRGMDAYQAMEEELRLGLARKITQLVPQLTAAHKGMLLEHTVAVLKMIAKDQTERVRQLVAEELSDMPGAPYELVRELAWDPSLRVSCPILEFSPLLRDDDLLDILKASPVQGVVEAIAQRAAISASVGDAIVKTHEPVAIQKLLKNEGAMITSDSMELIVTDAPNHEMWHAPLVGRPELTQKTVNRIAGFISQSLLADLEQQGKLKGAVKKETSLAVQQRLQSWTAEQERAALIKARQYYDAGRLSEEFVSGAVHSVNEPLVIASLSLLTQIRQDVVKRILRSENAKVITAICYEAGLSMRLAMDMQMKIGRVHHAKLLYARGGEDYPLTKDEMRTYLGIFTGD